MNGWEIVLNRFKPATSEPGWLQELRRNAITEFETLGYPTSKQELWRFTNVSALIEQPFELDGSRQPVDIPAIAGLEKHRLVFVNGVFSEGLSGELPAGVKVGSIAEHFDERIGKLANAQSAFVAANTAMFVDGAFLEVADGVELDAPIHLVFLTDREASVSHVRNLVTCGKGSRVAVVEQYVGTFGLTYWTNAVTEVFVGESAQLDHYKIQQESPSAYHFHTIESEIATGGDFSNHAVTIGSALGRNDIRGKMVGEQAEAVCNGLYLLRDKQHFDTHLFMDHAVPNCNSHELYKGILDERSHAVFCGRILVREDAQKTDAIQSNKNLLLSRSARVNTLPQLEIYADDVKCTHGATIGELDETALFYLQTRGIDRERGHAMLTFAFANEVLGSIRSKAVKSYIEQFVHKWLAEAAV